jgi:hypothetical protein
MSGARATSCRNRDVANQARVAFLDVRETSLLPEELAKATKHQIVIIYGDKAFWQQAQHEQQTRSKRFRIVAYLILLAAVGLFVPIPRR